MLHHIPPIAWIIAVAAIAILLYAWWVTRPPKTPHEELKEEREVVAKGQPVTWGSSTTHSPLAATAPLGDPANIDQPIIQQDPPLPTATVSVPFKLDKRGRKYDPKTGRKIKD